VKRKMLMPGPQELIFIFLIILLLFGASKLPELARSMGKSMGEFKKAQKESEISLKELEIGNEPSVKSKVQQTAENMGISIEGKTDDQLLEEIEKTAKK
jgi:sec-independent protein translocase protein TatA